MEKQITKNQHYVPQLLLQNFSIEEKGEYRSNVYDLVKEGFRENQNTKKICSRNYMYDKDNIVESFLSKNIEAPASVEISRIVSNPTDARMPAEIDLLRFLCVQLGRTQEAYDHALEFINAFSGTMFRELARLNNFDEESAEKLRLVPTDPRAIIARQTLDSALNWPLIKDLQHHVVINKSESEFIIADHPVFQYNWYLRDAQELSSTSIANKGVQLFLPLSTKVVYCLYDNSVYSYGASRLPYTEILNQADVDTLNSFQMLNASSLIVFRSFGMRHDILKLANEYGSLSTFVNHADYTEAEEDIDGKLKSLHAVWRTQTKLPRMPCFIKVKNKVRRKAVVCVERKPEVVVAVDAYKKKARSQHNAL